MELWRQSQRFVLAVAVALTLPACTGFEGGQDESRQGCASRTLLLERRLERRLAPVLNPDRPPVKGDLPRHYQQGVAWGRLDIALRGLLVERGPVPAVAVHELINQWQDQFEVWKSRSLSDVDLLYLWAEGFPLKSGLAGGGRSELLVLAGGERDGRIVLIDIETGPRGSSSPWKVMLQSLKKRGLKAPALCIADRELGIWPALREELPATRAQYCWNHLMDSVLARLPAELREAAEVELRGMATAGCEEEAWRKKLSFCARHAREWPQAVEALDRPWNRLLTLHRFPASHRELLATTAVLGSPLAALQLLSEGPRGTPTTASALAGIWKLLRVAESRFPRLERAKPSFEGELAGPVLAGRTERDR